MFIRFGNGKRLTVVHKLDCGASPLPQLEVEKPGEQFGNIKRFQINIPLEMPAEKSFTVVKNGDHICDYRDVKFTGYLSTFKNVTESDRQGDGVEKGAFEETLKNFRANPVLLTDHRNSVASLAGRFTEIKEDKNGLRFEAVLSNAPDVTSTRFKVAEGHLKTTSMGGLFHYKEDGRSIFKVDLWEGSLTPVPANPDAQFSVRSLNDMEKKFLQFGAKMGFSNFYEFEAFENNKQK